MLLLFDLNRYPLCIQAPCRSALRDRATVLSLLGKRAYLPSPLRFAENGAPLRLGLAMSCAELANSHLGRRNKEPGREGKVYLTLWAPGNEAPPKKRHGNDRKKPYQGNLVSEGIWIAQFLAVSFRAIGLYFLVSCMFVLH